jgi:tetratricopeptide (TPR) repeat protein
MKRPFQQRRRFLLLVCLACLAGCGRGLDLDSARTFQEAEKVFAQAKSPDDFLKAAAMDQEILDRGQISGAVLYNQGNAFMQAGQRGRAIAAYRQAQRYLGPDPFLQANLAFAQRNPAAAHRRPLIEHLLFWQDWISYPGKFHLAACGVTLTLVPALILLVIRRRWLVRLTFAAMAVSVLLIVSAGYDWYRYDWKTHGVIVEKEAVVRKGNAESYEPALTAPLEEGAEFDLVERRGDWLLIHLAGDQEGWIPDKAAVVY